MDSSSSSSSSAPRPDAAPSGQQIADSPIFKRVLGRAEDYVKKPLRIKQLLNDSYKKAAEKKDIGQMAGDVWESLQVLFRLIGAAVSGKYHGIPTTVLLGGTAVLLYFLSPIDAIPDFIPVIGLLDDVALLAWFTGTIKDEMDRFEAWERTSGEGAGHVALTPKPQAADLSREAHGQPAPEAARDHSLRALTTDGSRDSSHRADMAGGDSGGNVR
ncbi:MAG: DUF1232 domain-containing protein [Hymenobacteraceae bacterium]|nr:DUF1232 domain-containing protein [Hymenobacteraceae bacterium]